MYPQREVRRLTEEWQRAGHLSHLVKDCCSPIVLSDGAAVSASRRHVHRPKTAGRRQGTRPSPGGYCPRAAAHSHSGPGGDGTFSDPPVVAT